MYAGHFAAYARNQFKRFGLAYVAAHVGQHFVADVLQGNVEVFAHVAVACHHGQHLVGELGGVGVVQPYPFHAFYLRHSVDQFGQHHFAIQVEAIRRQVLCNHVELLHALGHKAPHLGQQLVDGH